MPMTFVVCKGHRENEGNILQKLTNGLSGHVETPIIHRKGLQNNDQKRLSGENIFF